jgi:hypothetical protein
MNTAVSVFLNDDAQGTVKDIGHRTLISLRERGTSLPMVDVWFTDMEHLEITLLNWLTQVQVLKAKALAGNVIALAAEPEETDAA